MVNVHSIKMEDFLDAKCTAACWKVGPRPALQQLQLLHLVQILHIGRYEEVRVDLRLKWVSVRFTPLPKTLYVRA